MSCDNHDHETPAAAAASGDGGPPTVTAAAGLQRFLQDAAARNAWPEGLLVDWEPSGGVEAAAEAARQAQDAVRCEPVGRHGLLGAVRAETEAICGSPFADLMTRTLACDSPRRGAMAAVAASSSGGSGTSSAVVSTRLPPPAIFVLVSTPAAAASSGGGVGVISAPPMQASGGAQLFEISLVGASAAREGGDEQQQRHDVACLIFGVERPLTMGGAKVIIARLRDARRAASQSNNKGKGQ